MATPNDAGCPGRFHAIRGRTAPFCCACPRHEPGAQLEPRAAYVPELRGWHCPDRPAQKAATLEGQG